MRDRDYDRDVKPRDAGYRDRERGGRYRQADDGYDRRYDRDYRSRHGGHRDDRRDRRSRGYSRDWDEPKREEADRMSIPRDEPPIKYELDERADKVGIAACRRINTAYMPTAHQVRARRDHCAAAAKGGYARGRRDLRRIEMPVFAYLSLSYCYRITFSPLRFETQTFSLPALRRNR